MDHHASETAHPQTQVTAAKKRLEVKYEAAQQQAVRNHLWQ
jgi:hypothetical protein